MEISKELLKRTVSLIESMYDFEILREQWKNSTATTMRAKNYKEALKVYENLKRILEGDKE